MNEKEVKQKYKRGNVVKVLFGHQVWSSEGESDMSPEEVGRLAIIDGSYADLYGGSDRNNYAIVFCDTGSRVAWKTENQLQFVEEGGEHLFVQAQINKEQLVSKHESLSYIVENWNSSTKGLSSISILYLFDRIGFKSAFLKNGEYYSLFADWETFSPLFNAIMSCDEGKINELLSAQCTQETKDSIFALMNEVRECKQ